MVRILVCSLGILCLLSSCCFVRPTSAQSDRLETRKPIVPVVECIPCSTLKNQPSVQLWGEAWGANGKWMIGFEPGYSTNYFSIIADLGSYWWPSGSMKWSMCEQVAVVPFNPDLLLHPELGIGLQQHYYRSELKRGPGSYWQTFAGMRVNVPFSNISAGVRVYRVNSFTDSVPNWNFGLQLAFRL